MPPRCCRSRPRPAEASRRRGTVRPGAAAAGYRRRAAAVRRRSRGERSASSALQKRRSHAIASSRPALNASPSIAAITGRGSSAMQPNGSDSSSPPEAACSSNSSSQPSENAARTARDDDGSHAHLTRRSASRLPQLREGRQSDPILPVSGCETDARHFAIDDQRQAGGHTASPGRCRRPAPGERSRASRRRDPGS